MAEDELTLKLTLVKTEWKLVYIFFGFYCFNATLLQNVYQSRLLYTFLVVFTNTRTQIDLFKVHVPTKHK